MGKRSVDALAFSHGGYEATPVPRPPLNAPGEIIAFLSAVMGLGLSGFIRAEIQQAEELYAELFRNKDKPDKRKHVWSYLMSLALFVLNGIVGVWLTHIYFQPVLVSLLVAGLFVGCVALGLALGRQQGDGGQRLAALLSRPNTRLVVLAIFVSLTIGTWTGLASLSPQVAFLNSCLIGVSGIALEVFHYFKMGNQDVPD